MSSKTSVPLLDLGAQNQPLRTEIMEAVGRVIDSGQFILGSEVERLEAAIARVCEIGRAHV